MSTTIGCTFSTDPANCTINQCNRGLNYDIFEGGEHDTTQSFGGETPSGKYH
jgi:hypothetical protein